MTEPEGKLSATRIGPPGLSRTHTVVDTVGIIETIVYSTCWMCKSKYTLPGEGDSFRSHGSKIVTRAPIRIVVEELVSSVRIKEYMRSIHIAGVR
jgi:hypothetical protein